LKYSKKKTGKSIENDDLSIDENLGMDMDETNKVFDLSPSKISGSPLDSEKKMKPTLFDKLTKRKSKSNKPVKDKKNKAKRDDEVLEFFDEKNIPGKGGKPFESWT
jgi:hypothetical protein